MKEAADAVQIPRSGTPGFFGFARGAAEAPVVVWQETAKNLIGGIQIGGASQTQLTGKAILEGTPETFDAALGLGRVGGDVGDAQLSESAAELGRLSLAELLFLDLAEPRCT